MASASGEPIEWDDLGTMTADPTDYPNHAHKLVAKVLETRSLEDLTTPCGVLVCGSGVGMSIAANRYKKIRAVLAYRADVAALSRQHNASNVLCLGARISTTDEVKKIFVTWLSTSFEGDRHQKRIDLMDTLDDNLESKKKVARQ